MSQSLYSAMSGITAASTDLEVISNNVANINTWGYKSSSVNFSDVYSKTISYGSVSSGSSGGTNPVQIGVGTQVSSISKDFTSGSASSTGLSTDLMITTDNGFFTVQGTDGTTYYTRDGNFTFDDSGNLVTSDGYKVLGTDSISSKSSSTTTVKVPTSIIADVEGTTASSTTPTVAGSATISSLNNLTKDITTGSFTVTVTNASGTATPYTVTLGTTDLSGTVNNMLSTINTALSGSGVTAAAASDGTITFTVSPTTSTVAFSTPTTGASNFITATDLSNTQTSTGVYSTGVLNYDCTISDVTSAADSTSIKSETIGTDGSVQAKYANGATLSVALGDDGETYNFVYTTSTGTEITGSNLSVSSDVAVPGNFVVQTATVTNENGLLSAGSNLYEAGSNTGKITYTVAGEMGCGSIKSGYLESSNVDFSKELSNMLLAQRAIEANSRVFTTSSDVLSTIVQMGK